MNKRALLSSLVCHPVLYPASLRISDKHVLRILAYHRVLDIDEQLYPFDNELISASVRDFEKQMEYVSAHYRVMTFKDIEKCEKNGAQLPDRSLIITFDDGYADNYENAFPILKKYRLKAVFFLSTDYIDNSTAFWFERLAYYRKKGLIETDRLGLERYSGVLENGWRETGPFPSEDLYRIITRVPNGIRLSLLQQIEQSLPEIPEEDIPFVKALSWGQVLEMDQYGMEIGSHTQSHMILGNGTSEEISSELKLSRQIIEEKISGPVSAISYPIASYTSAMNPWVINLARQTGYHWGISNFPGPVKNIEKERYLLKRLRIERYVSFDRFKSKLLFPEILA